MRPLGEAYVSVREFLHSNDRSDEAREELRSLSWAVAEALERFGLSGREVRNLGDDLTGDDTSAALHDLMSDVSSLSDPTNRKTE